MHSGADEHSGQHRALLAATLAGEGQHTKERGSQAAGVSAKDPKTSLRREISTLPTPFEHAPGTLLGSKSRIRGIIGLSLG
jgi:hypothetical protein